MSRTDNLHQLMQNFQNLFRGMHQTSNFLKDGIPFGQKAALFTIALHDNINVKQLASMLHVTSGAATQHIEALVQDELVERHADPHDRRQVNIVLSAKGRAVIKRLEESRLKMFRELFEGISDGELETYNDVMEKINIKIKQRNEKT